MHSSDSHGLAAGWALLATPEGNGWPLSTTLFGPLKRPIPGAPFLGRIMVTTTSSPGLNEFLAQPCLVMSGGLLASTIQCCTSPFSSFESNFNQQWGLAQIHSVTVPFTVVLVPVAYAAFPWCANSGAETTKTPAATRNMVVSLLLIGSLRNFCPDGARSYTAFHSLPMQEWL